MHIPILSITAALLMAGLTYNVEEHRNAPVLEDKATTTGSTELRPQTLELNLDEGNADRANLRGPGLPQSGTAQTPEINESDRLERYLDASNVEVFEIEELDPLNDESFGFSVALTDDGDTAVVGSPRRNVYIYEEDKDTGVRPLEVWCGRVTVYRRTGNTWEEIQILKPEPTVYEDENNSSLSFIQFGYSVDISNDGTFIIVGAPFYNNTEMYDTDFVVDNATNCGKAYLYKLHGGTAGTYKHQVDFLPFHTDTPPQVDCDDDEDDCPSGQSCVNGHCEECIDDLGCPTGRTCENGFCTGGIHDNTAFDWFGYSVSISEYGDVANRPSRKPRAIIGAPYDNNVVDVDDGEGGTVETESYTGAIYIIDAKDIFGNNWPGDFDGEDDDVFKDVQHDGEYFTQDFFGCSVSIDYDHAIAGAKGHGHDEFGDYEGDVGRAYVYEEVEIQPPGSGRYAWELEATLMDQDANAGEHFGHSVSITSPNPDDPLETISITRAIVGTPYDDFGAGACCFGDTCIDRYELWDCYLAGGAFLGGYSDCNSSTCQLEAPCCNQTDCYEDLDGVECWDQNWYFFPGYDNCNQIDALCTGNVLYGYNRGSASIFKETPFGWVLEEKIYPDDGVTRDWFGFSVSINGEAAIIGASISVELVWNNWEATGAAYFFHYDSSSDSWIRSLKLIHEIRDDGDEFGYSVALSEADIGTNPNSGNLVYSYIALVGAPSFDYAWNQDDYPDDPLHLHNTGAAYGFEPSYDLP